MASPPRLDPIASEPSEEEVEELGTLTSTSSSTLLPKQSFSGGREGSRTSTFARVSARSARDVPTFAAGVDDEFALDLPYVSAKADQQLLKQGPFMLASKSSFVGSSGVQPRRQGLYGLLGHGAPSQAGASAPKLTSIASRWDSGEGATLNQYKGSEVLDDMDRPQDEAEYQAWIKRDAQRRKDLLA